MAELWGLLLIAAAEARHGRKAVDQNMATEHCRRIQRRKAVEQIYPEIVSNDVDGNNDPKKLPATR